MTTYPFEPLEGMTKLKNSDRLYHNPTFSR